MHGLSASTIRERKPTVPVLVVFVRVDVADEHELIVSDLCYSHRGLRDLSMRTVRIYWSGEINEPAWTSICRWAKASS